MKGGARRGAGRKPGGANRKTREIADRAAVDGVIPLEYLLKVLRQPAPEGADALTQLELDKLRLDAAKSAAPYMHPRPSAIDAPVKLPLRGDVGDDGRAVLVALGEGAITPMQAATVMQAVAAYCRVLEADELENRVAAVEGAAAAHRKRGGNG